MTGPAASIVGVRTYGSSAVSSRGGGVFVDASCSATLDGVHVEGATSSGASALLVNGGQALVKNSVFSQCTSTTGKGGVVVKAGGHLDLVNMLLDGLRGRRGGCLYVEQGSVQLSQGTTLAHCVAEQDGGAVLLDSASLDMGPDTRIVSSSAPLGGCITMTGTAPTLRGSGASSLVANCSAQSGGALYLEAAPTSVAHVTDVSVTDSHSGIGGGVAIVSNTSAALSNVHVARCVASDNGGAVHMGNAASLSIEDSTFTNSTAALMGGGLHLQAKSHLDSTRLTVRTCSAGGSGGGAVLETNATWVGHASTTLEECDATTAGGLLVSGAHVHVDSVTAQHCVAQADGGGVAVLGQHAHVTLEGVVATECSAGKDKG
jgi:hypothetical protein